MSGGTEAMRRFSEFELIKKYFSRHGDSNMVLGSGDDCAIFDIPFGQHLVFSIDTVVEGRHFPQGLEPQHIATRALGAALSDLAAMGARPDHFTLALSLPEINQQWLQSFSDSIYQCADEYQISLVGGDTTKGPLSITIQVHGTVPKGEALTRGGAQSGDGIFLSGVVGDARAGLELSLSKEQPASRTEEYLLSKFLRPRPQLETAQRLRPYSNACIDISDGLLSDVGHIAKASGLEAHIELGRVPMSEQLVTLFPDQARAYALGGGDDYELVFAVSPRQQSYVRALGLTRIGHFKSPDDGRSESVPLVLWDGDKQVSADHFGGFQHFS